MPDLSKFTGAVYLHRLSAEVAVLLTGALVRAGCALIRRRPDEALPREVEMVFCSCESGILRDALRLSRGRPVVVVSRLPDVSGWLDALEAGAADYLAAPFGPIEISWLLNSHGGTRRGLARAAVA